MIIMRRFIFLLAMLLLFLVPLFSGAQGKASLASLEDSLLAISRRIQVSGNDSARLALNLRFIRTLKTAIGTHGSFSHPFDSLKKLGKLTSPDKTFRMYNWNIPLTEGSNRYFCLVQFPVMSDRSGPDFIELTDRSDSIPDPEHSLLNYTSWYGALYYKIVPQMTDSGMTYTLLGWEGVSASAARKIIEIMTFDEKGMPHFGKKLFNRYRDGNNTRVIFSYPSQTPMVVRYEEAFITEERKWNAARKEFEEKRAKVRMIVCDRLVTLEGREGSGMQMVPAGDIFDGFRFENGRWNFIEGVDARND
jgi:hypothetical protein